MRSLTKIWQPKSVKDIIGQKHLLNENGIILRMINNKKIYSLIFFGNPGTGKTSIAMAVANDLNVPYQIYNSAYDSKSKLMQIIKKAKETNGEYVIIVEEIHRLNKDKQDILLSLIENMEINLFATTTENPFFVVNPALRSRCQLLKLEQISENDIYDALLKKLSTNKNFSEEVIKAISTATNGDLRIAINIVDILLNLYSSEQITVEKLKEIFPTKPWIGAKYGDELHNLKSAFHKSLRGSDVNASLHYLSRLINIGDLEAISRRMIMVTYEDVGLAAPSLAPHVLTGLNAVKEVGFPEATTILANLTIEIALAPKSNAAYMAINEAINDLKTGVNFTIPHYLQDANYKSASKLGVKGYKYPHSYANSWVAQDYLPKNLQHANYYKPKITSIHEQKMLKVDSERKKLGNNKS